MAKEKPVMAKAKMVQKIVELDEDLVLRFNRVYPMHGAFSRILRTLIKTHLNQMDKASEKFWEGHV